MKLDTRDALAEAVTVLGLLSLVAGVAFTGAGATAGVPLMVGGLAAALAGAYAGR